MTEAANGSLADLIPDDLNMSTADRLRLVADIIERHPEAWDQSSLIPDGSFMVESDLLGKGTACGTRCCVAGWATLLATSDHSVNARAEDFIEDTAQSALGLAFDLANALFYGWSSLGLDENPRQFATFLRGLASLPEPRTLDQAEALVHA